MLGYKALCVTLSQRCEILEASERALTGLIKAFSNFWNLIRNMYLYSTGTTFCAENLGKRLAAG